VATVIGGRPTINHHKKINWIYLDSDSTSHFYFGYVRIKFLSTIRQRKINDPMLAKPIQSLAGSN
jgi:hypothetical protein